MCRLFVQLFSGLHLNMFIVLRLYSAKGAGRFCFVRANPEGECVWSHLCMPFYIVNSDYVFHSLHWLLLAQVVRLDGVN